MRILYHTHSAPHARGVNERNKSTPNLDIGCPSWELFKQRIPQFLLALLPIQHSRQRILRKALVVLFILELTKNDLFLTKWFCELIIGVLPPTRPTLHQLGGRTAKFVDMIIQIHIRTHMEKLLI